MDRLGSKVKAIRKSRGMTLRDLAEIIGCTPGYISQIEKGQSNPSIATLKRIATALGVKLVDFFLEDEEDDEIVMRKGEGLEIRYPQGDASIFLLVRNLRGRTMEPLLARFEPGAGSHGLYAHSGGQEFGYVIRGELELTVEDKVFRLKEGDSFYFDSIRPHGYVNTGEGVAEVIWVISPPTY